MMRKPSSPSARKIYKVRMYGIYRYRAGTARINACGDSREQNIRWMFVLLRPEWNEETRSMKQETHCLKPMGSSRRDYAVNISNN